MEKEYVKSSEVKNTEVKSSTMAKPNLDEVATTNKDAEGSLGVLSRNYLEAKEALKQLIN